MRLLSLLLAVVLVGGCATAPKPAVAPEKAWNSRQEALSNVRHWRLSGRIAVKTEQESVHGHLQWSQAPKEYDIRISGPFGSGTLRLAGSRSGAALWVDDEPPVRSGDPERMLYRRTGWWIPVDALRYWILGLPTPRLNADWELDSYGRIEKLRQAGWEIRFLDYEQRNGVELPGRVFVSKGEAEVKVVVQQWQQADAKSRAASREEGNG